MADRGFDIQDAVGLHCARIIFAAFHARQKQLEGVQVEKTRNIANLRIHVERVMGLLRQKYAYLGTTIPIDTLTSKDGCVPVMDKIFRICCSLLNMFESVVPLISHVTHKSNYVITFFSCTVPLFSSSFSAFRTKPNICSRSCFQVQAVEVKPFASAGTIVSSDHGAFTLELWFVKIAQ